MTCGKLRALRSSTMSCEDKLRLICTYTSSVHKFSAAVSKFNDKVIGMSSDDFKLAYELLDRVLQDCVVAKMKLETHVKTHRC